MYGFVDLYNNHCFMFYRLANGTDSCQYIDTPRCVDTTSDPSKAHVEPGRSASRPSSGSVATTASSVERSPNPAKPVTPRDVLNSASVRGDLFPRLPMPAADSVSSSKRAIAHSSATTQSLAKSGVHLTDISAGHNEAVATANDTSESRDKTRLTQRLDLLVKASSSAVQHGTNLAQNEKPNARYAGVSCETRYWAFLLFDAQGDTVMSYGCESPPNTLSVFALLVQSCTLMMTMS